MVRLNAFAKLALVPILFAAILVPATPDTPASALSSQVRVFNLEEATIADITAAFDAGALSCRQLTQMYLNRIAAYDKTGPTINSIITVSPRALETAAALDA